MKKIGLLGGTFDPPHAGHLAVAHAAIEGLGLDEVLFLPASKNPLKKAQKPSQAHHRLAMLKLALEDEPKIAISDLEMTRGGVSYSVDTLMELQMVQPAEYWFLMGADALKGFENWKTPEKILRMCRLGVVARLPIKEHELLWDIPLQFHPLIDLIPMDLKEISSTEIRERILRNKPTGDMLAPKVLQYIRQNGLYKS